ncbi:MAG: ABC transporter substrate-binding protein [Acidobacteriota bacterium]|nr:ABC transporter substrate-binding protein [Acidobacteriota bacterium]
MVLVAATVLTASACNSNRGTSSTGSTSAGATTATSASATSSTFGTLASPCGPGSAHGATEQGVTDTSIRIGYGDDRGFSQSPGLDQEMGDAVTALIKWCNDQGGILGRKIVGDNYDAAITQVNTVMQQACKSDFMLVGEGFALDEAAESTRIGCNLAAVPGFTVGPDVANAPEMYQAVPNPVDYLPASVYYEIAKLFPQDVTAFDALHTTLTSATEVSYAKDILAAQAAGWKLANCGVKISYYGEPNYTPFAQKFQACGAKTIYNDLGPGPVLFGMMTANFQLGLKPLYVMETNDYTTQMSSWNTNGIGDNVYVRDAFVPLEEADINPAVAKYVSLVGATGGKVSQLGQQAASSFLLWATEAKACGSTLTRQCMINDLSKVHNWTGGGLHAPTDPGNNTPPQCGMLLKLTGTTFSQAYPSTRGQFDCNPEYLFKIPQSAWGTTLNSDRLATKFLSANVIKPQ